MITSRTALCTGDHFTCDLLLATENPLYQAALKYFDPDIRLELLMTNDSWILQNMHNYEVAKWSVFDGSVLRWAP